MKSIFKFLEDINSKYDSLKEPSRFSIFFLPMLMLLSLFYTVSHLFFIPIIILGLLRMLYIHDFYKKFLEQ